MLRKLLLLMVSFTLWQCGGTKPQPTWTASEYFDYAMQKFQEEDYYDASNEFTVIVLRYAGSALADSAQFYLAESHFRMDEYLIAAVEYEKLINNMSRSKLVPDAQYMLAECYYKLSPRPSLDQEYTEKALREFQIFIEEFPAHEKRDEADEKLNILRNRLAQKKWQNADIYRKMREYKAALIYFEQVLQLYHDSEWADDALLGKIQTFMDMDEYQQARNEIERFENSYPNSPLMEEVKALTGDLPVGAASNE